MTICVADTTSNPRYFASDFLCAVWNSLLELINTSIEKSFSPAILK
jgi:hypothetical protein